MLNTLKYRITTVKYNLHHQSIVKKWATNQGGKQLDYSPFYNTIFQKSFQYHHAKTM